VAVIKRFSMVRTLLVAGLVACIVQSAAAQAPAPPAQRQDAPAGRSEQDVPEVLPDAVLADMLDTYAIVQAQRELTIADERYGTFAARLKKLQNVRRRNQRQRQQIIRQLVRIAGPRATEPADDAAIRAQLTALREHDDRAAVELRQAYDALDEILDIRQQARFRVFEEQIERRKLDLLVKARSRALQKPTQ
jgi:hypothetical protein